MYKQLTYTPDNILQCSETGCIAIITYHDDYCYEDTIDVHDDELSRIEFFDIDHRDLDVSRIRSVVIISNKIDPSKMAMLTYYLRDGRDFTTNPDDYEDVIWEFSEEFNKPVSYSPKPSRVFNIDNIIYRIPTALTDFASLPKVQPYTRKMIWCVRVLRQHLDVIDVVVIVVMLSLELYRDLEYAQYCEQQGYRSQDYELEFKCVDEPDLLFLITMLAKVESTQS